MKTKFIFSLTIILSLLIHNVNAQLIIDNTSMTPAQLVQNVLANSTSTISNIAYSGYIPNSIGKFSTGSLPTNLGLTTGIIMSTGNVMDAIGPNLSTSTTNSNGTGSDVDLASLIPGYTVNDAAVLSFSFVPISDTLKIRYVFASEEYPEWAGSSFNDVFGLFLSGPGISGPFSNNAMNIALIPGTSLPVSIDNINSGQNAQYYVDNTAGTTIEYDGFTTVFTTWALVTPYASYHIKIAIGDAGDSAYDSAIFLEQGNFINSTSNNGPLCTGNTLNLFTATTGSSYYWTGPDGFVSTQQNPVIDNVTLVNAGTYQVFIIMGSDTVLLGETTVEVIPSTIIDLGDDMVLCDYVTMVLNAGSGYNNYIWKTDVFSQTISYAQTIAVSASVYGIGTHKFWVKTTSDNGCEHTDTIQVTFQDCSGIEEVTSNEVNIFPNPPTNAVQIVLPVDFTGNTLIQMLDISGKEIISESVFNNNITLNTKNLLGGIYYIKVTNNDKCYIKELLIK